MRDKSEGKCYVGPLPNSLPSPTTLKHARTFVIPFWLKNQISAASNNDQ